MELAMPLFSRFTVLFSLLLAAAAPAQSAVQFKLATIAPEGSGWMRELRAAADEVADRTEGRVKIKYYPGGVMGNDKKVLRKIRIGQLQGGAFTSSGLSERYADIVIYGLPLVFNDANEIAYVREQMDPLLMAGLSEAGLEALGMAGGGFANLMGAEQVSTLDELRGRKVWGAGGRPGQLRCHGVARPVARGAADH
jgi:TRAP-type C4-dicarboxylate transport system substrate-binding protein